MKKYFFVVFILILILLGCEKPTSPENIELSEFEIITKSA